MSVFHRPNRSVDLRPGESCNFESCHLDPLKFPRQAAASPVFGARQADRVALRRLEKVLRDCYDSTLGFAHEMTMEILW